MTGKIDKKIKKTLLNLLKFQIDLTNEIKSLSKKELDKVLDTAKKHHIKEYLYFNLQKNNLLSLFDKEQLDDLKNSFKQSTFRNMSLLAEIKKISKEFEKNNIPMIVLKGPHLMQDIYPHIALRYSRDIDILIPEDKGEEAYSLLNNFNYTCEKELTVLDFEFTYGRHMHQISNKKFVIELHSNIDENLDIDINDFWKCSTNGKFSIEDLIIHLSIHISYSDLFKIDLRHYLDLYLLLEKYEEKIDWNKLKNKATQNKCLEGVYLMFKIIQKLLDIKLPNEIENFYLLTKEQKQVIDLAIEFMWLYDKSSKDYFFYRYKNATITKSTNLVKSILTRIFISKDELAYIYSLNKNSKKLYIYYFIRFFDLIKNHGKKTLDMNLDQQKKDFTTKTIYVYNYLNKGN